MYEDNMNGYLGHSNDSLFASADEMAGNYSPRNDNHEFTPARDTTPTQLTPRGSSGHRSGHSENMDLNYPMPDEIEIWRQAEHPDSINKLLNITGDVCQETFRGAAKMLSHANPETFEMPLEARFICMKVDTPSDMRYCLTNGGVTCIPSCNERINAVWFERNGQRVFMMFSISGQKEFCAMAEMVGPVGPGRMPGWSKSGCEGLVLLTFIYVKNVPFSLINHIKHKSNGQPVANMWNSMMYHDNTGYHVARIYCEHPVLSSVLVKIHTEVELNYKSQLRIPASGNTAYSASSFSSQNNKSHDPRSATRPHIHRSGNRTHRSNASWWRSDGIPPTPSRQPGQFYHPGKFATPTPVASQRRITNQQNTAGAAQSPPPFTLPGSGSDGSQYARSFTTADDRMIAEFASSRDAKRSEANQKNSSGFQQVEAKVQDPFHVDRTLHNGQTRNSPGFSSNQNGPSHDVRVNRAQGGAYGAQWQGNRHAAPASIYSDKSATSSGIAPGAHPFSREGQQPFYATGMPPPQLPSPMASSQSSHYGSSHSNDMRRQQSHEFSLRSPPSYNPMPLRRGHGHPAPRPNVLVAQNPSTKPVNSHQQQSPVPGNPIRHSQSMPVMMAHVTHRLSAQHLRSHNTAAKSGSVDTTSAASPSIQGWVELTPTRGAVALAEQTPSKALTVQTSTSFEESPEKPVRSADMADRLKWHQAMAAALEVEIKIAETNGQSTSEKRDMLKYHNAKVVCYEVEIEAAHREQKEACGSLAKSTAKCPPASPSTPHNSADWPNKAHGSSIESDLIAPEIDEYGKILRSVSKNREGKATHVGQKIRHRRGNVGDNGGFTSSFDERMNATVQDLLRSPTRVNAYSTSRPARTHGHPHQRTEMPLAHGQHDPCTEDQQCNEDDRYYYEYIHNEDTCDFASQIGAPEDDDEVFSPRGRTYHHTQPARDVSQMSCNGGIELGDGHKQK